MPLYTLINKKILKKKSTMAEMFLGSRTTVVMGRDNLQQVRDFSIFGSTSSQVQVVILKGIFLFLIFD